MPLALASLSKSDDHVANADLPVHRCGANSSTITSPLGEASAAAFALSPALKAARNIFAASSGVACALPSTETPSITPATTNPWHNIFLIGIALSPWQEITHSVRIHSTHVDCAAKA